jgi:hypothetical protein
LPGWFVRFDEWRFGVRVVPRRHLRFLDWLDCLHELRCGSLPHQHRRSGFGNMR